MGNPAIPVPTETILATWGADVVSRIVGVYADTAARDQAHPFPEAGQGAYLEDTDTLTMYTGSAWQAVNKAWHETNFEPFIATPVPVELTGGKLSNSWYTIWGGVVTVALQVISPFDHWEIVATLPTLISPSAGEYRLDGWEDVVTALPHLGGSERTFGLRFNGQLYNVMRDADDTHTYKMNATWVLGGRGFGN